MKLHSDDKCSFLCICESPHSALVDISQVELSREAVMSSSSKAASSSKSAAAARDMSHDLHVWLMNEMQYDASGADGYRMIPTPENLAE